MATATFKSANTRFILTGIFAAAGLPFLLTAGVIILIYFDFNISNGWDEIAKDYNPPAVILKGLALLVVGVGTFYRRGLACSAAVAFYGYGLLLSGRWALWHLPAPASDWLPVALICAYASLATAALVSRIRAWRWP